MNNMEKTKYSRKDIQDKINKSFEDKVLTKEKLKKLKQLAMSKNIKLGDLRKKFCKGCYSLFTTKNSELRIKKPIMKIRCKDCGYITRYKINK
jgi:RNase P subunit RPR2